MIGLKEYLICVSFYDEFTNCVSIIHSKGFVQNKFSANKFSEFVQMKCLQNGKDIIIKAKSCYMYMDFKTHVFPPKRVIIRLFVDITPQTCLKFAQSLAQSIKDKQPFRLKDDTAKSMFKLKSEIKADLLDDENFILKVESEGWITISNQGPHSNNISEFWVSTQRNANFDQKGVVFGQIVYNFNVLAGLVEKNKDLGVKNRLESRLINWGVIRE